MTRWNEIYKEPEAYTYYDLGLPHEDIPCIASFFEQRGVRDVLDLGCGSGRNLFYLVKRGFSVSGIDNAPEGIQRIRENMPDAHVTVGDIYKPFPYADNSFDAIISVQVLQHATEDKIRGAIQEMQRVLRPGGYIFVTICGRFSKGKVRYCLVKTAKKIAPHTYVPTKGKEEGLTHFIYNRSKIKEHFSKFNSIDQWKDSRDYFCLLAQLPEK